MLRFIIFVILIFPLSALSKPWFNGQPDFADQASQELAKKVLAAHGGMKAMNNVESFQFNFFTKAIGVPAPFYSIETLDLNTGSSYIDWPLFNATTAWNQETVWSEQWPLPLPAGFFSRLTSSFLTLPWQMYTDNANISLSGQDTLPDDDAKYDILKITFDQRNPSIPGTYYEMFIDPESHLMRAIRFDINHPGMAANPNQPLGPNLHVFGEYNQIGGLVIPTYYKTYGQRSNNSQISNAYHFVWDIKANQDFDHSRLVMPKTATVDEVSLQWWESN